MIGIRHQPPVPEGWALIGLRNGNQPMVWRGLVSSFAYHMPRTPLYSLNDMNPVRISGGIPEVRAEVQAYEGVSAATFADCLRMIAEKWSPDGTRGPQWRPIPR